MTCCCRVAFFHSHPERADPLTRKDPPSNSNENDMSGSVSSACDVNKKKSHPWWQHEENQATRQNPMLIKPCYHMLSIRIMTV